MRRERIYTQLVVLICIAFRFTSCTTPPLRASSIDVIKVDYPKSVQEVVSFRDELQEPVTGIALTSKPDVVIVKGERHLRILNIKTRRIIRQFDTGTGGVFAVSRDGSMFAVTLRDSVDIVFSETGKRVVSLPRERNITSMAFSHDRRFLAICGMKLGGFATPYGVLSVWDLKNATVSYDLETKEGPIYCVAFSPVESHLAIGTGNRAYQWGIANSGRLRIIDLETKTVIDNKPAHTGWVVALEFAPDGSEIASAGTDGTLRIWPARTLTDPKELQVSGEVRQIAWSPGGILLALATHDGIALFDGSAKKEYRNLFPNNHWESIAFDPSGIFMATASRAMGFSIWRFMN